MTTLAGSERAALCDLLDELGPDAPTLCGTWTTRDLAAHLVVRESRPDAALGIIVRAWAPWTKRVQDGAADDGWASLVQRLRGGPPLWSPTRISPLDSMVNDAEFFVHHEDVRRASDPWEPRTMPQAADATLWDLVSKRARLHLRRAPVGVTLETPDARTVVARPGPTMVTVTGHAGELLLLLFGRAEHAVLDFSGDDASVAALRDTSFAV
jgi:uncharacterized protein (TIGR03085 family)